MPYRNKVAGVACLSFAFYLLAEGYRPAEIIDPWWPHLPLIALTLLGLAWALPLASVPMAARALTVFYTGLALLAAGYQWAHLKSSYDPAWGGVWLALAVGGGLVYAAQTPRGQKWLGASWLGGLTVSLVTLFLLGALGEAFVRNQAVRHQIGAYPLAAAEENQTPRQSNGAQDMPFPMQKDPDKRRILLIGDSFTYGYSVFPQDRYAAFLQELAGPGAEVVVLAYTGASTLDQLGLWRSNGVGVGADVVVIGAVSNDLDLDLVPVPLGLIEDRVFTALFPKSQLAYFLDAQNLPARWRGVREAQGVNQELYIAWEAALYNDEQTVSEWRALLQTFYAEITATGAQAYAFTLITPFNLEQESQRVLWEGVYATLAGGFAEAGFQSTNLWAAYLAEYGERPFLELCALPNDCHPNADYHRWIAEQIWEGIQNPPPND
jgi:lysophospholipase L1-like esterase